MQCVQTRQYIISLDYITKQFKIRFFTDQIEALDPALAKDINHHFADELCQVSNELISTGAVGKSIFFLNFRFFFKPDSNQLA